MSGLWPLLNKAMGALADNNVFERPVNGALYLMRKYGFKLFPIIPNGKIPAVGGWQEWAQGSDEEKVIAYANANPLCNWGIFPEASGHLVIDIDIKQYTEKRTGQIKWRQGPKSLQALEKENSPIPETLIFKSHSGGNHRVLRGLGNSRTDLRDGIDVKSVGGYVVAPGSRINGRPYEIFEEKPIADCPQWFLDILEESKEPLFRPDDSEVEESIAEGSRDTELTRWAGVLRGQGLICDEMIGALHAMNAKRCSPPLPDDQVEKIARSIGNKPRGEAEAIAAFSGEANPDEMKAENDWPIEIEHFELGKARSRPWVIKDWLPDGEISSLYGSGSTGKSLLSLQLGLSVSSGQDFLGQKIECPMMVIGVYCEDSRDELHRRLDDIRAAAEYSFRDNDANKKFVLWPRAGKDNALVITKKDDVVPGPFMPKLKAYLAQLPRAEKKLLILDTLSDIYMGDENIRERVNKCIKVHISTIAKESNSAVLLLAHPSRLGQGNGDLLSGSTAWENAVRNRLGITKRENVTVLQRLKSNYAKCGDEIPMIWEAGRFVLASGQSAEEKKQRKDLGAYLFQRIELGKEENVSSLVDDISTESRYRGLFDGIKSAKHRKTKLIKLLKDGVEHEGVKFVYKFLAGARTKHIVSAVASVTESVFAESLK